MGRRKKTMVEAGLCAKGLHPWVEVRKRCMDCQREASYRAAAPKRLRPVPPPGIPDTVGFCRVCGSPITDPMTATRDHGGSRHTECPP